MEDQSPYVSSSNAGRHSPEPEEQPYHAAGEPQPHKGDSELGTHHGPGHPDHWKVLGDVLDLTGELHSHPPFSVSFPDKKEEEDEDKQPCYSDSLEPSPEEEEPSSIGSDVPRAQVIPSAPAEEHDTVAAPYKRPSSGSVVVDLLYWRDIKKSGAVFGASLFLLLSLTVFSIVSVTAYIALALLSVSISFRIYKGVLQAIQKSDDGHPFKQYLDTDVSVSEDLVKKYCNLALEHINRTAKELRRLFLVEDLVDSLKFAVLMWVFTYIGALFNGLTLLILALISLFSIPVVYERHQAQVDHYLGLISKNVNNIKELILSKVPGLKRKAE